VGRGGRRRHLAAVGEGGAVRGGDDREHARGS
jgi:hypothetical protein